MEFMELSPKSMEYQGVEYWIYDKNIRAWSPKYLEDWDIESWIYGID